MKRIIITKVYSCYECPNYSVDRNTGKDQCYINGYITVKTDRDGYLIDKDCPLKEDK